MNSETARTLITAASAVIIPVLLAVLGNNYTAAMKEREIRAQYVKIAVDILQAPPSEDNRNVREWATEVINLYSGVPLSQKAQDDLVLRVPISGVALGLKFNQRLPEDEIKEYQQLLFKLGYYEGEITGQIDQPLVEAIIGFQKDSGIFADGVIGKQTSEMLRKAIDEEMSESDK